MRAIWQAHSAPPHEASAISMYAAAPASADSLANALLVCCPLLEQWRGKFVELLPFSSRPLEFACDTRLPRTRRPPSRRKKRVVLTHPRPRQSGRPGMRGRVTFRSTRWQQTSNKNQRVLNNGQPRSRGALVDAIVQKEAHKSVSWQAYARARSRAHLHLLHTAFVLRRPGEGILAEIFADKVKLFVLVC